MFFDLFLAATLYALGAMVFGPFEERTPLLKRLVKLGMYLGVTALLAATVGHPWSLLWIFGMMGVGLTFHIWWTTSHGIAILRPEPRDKYYALRGWSE